MENSKNLVVYLVVGLIVILSIFGIIYFINSDDDSDSDTEDTEQSADSTNNNRDSSDTNSDGNQLEDNDSPTDNNTDQGNATNTSSFSLEEISEADGKSGNRCLVALDDVVYEVVDSEFWVDGVHTKSNGLAECGKDLTAVIDSSPHGRTVLDDMTEVGMLE